MYYQDILCSLDSIKQKYQLVDGIFRNNGIYSASQGQTSDTFAFKWAKRATYESDVVHQKAQQWLFDRYLDGNIRNRTRVLKWGVKS